MVDVSIVVSRRGEILRCSETRRETPSCTFLMRLLSLALGPPLVSAVKLLLLVTGRKS